MTNDQGNRKRSARYASARLALLLGILLAAGQTPSAGQVDPVAGGADSQAAGHAADPSDQADAPPGTADDELARRRAYSVGMVMLGGILICGVSLVAVALIWGNRVRRIARQPLPKVAERDELWYLKNKPAPAAGSDEPEPDDSPERPG